MRLFSKKTAQEKQQIVEEKRKKKESSAMFLGDILEPLGKIPVGSVVVIRLNPDDEVLNLHHDDIDIKLPYSRIRSFKVEDEVKAAKNGSTIGRALAGNALFGGVGAVVGAMSGKNNAKIRWLATLTYEDKNGNIQEIYFLQRALTGPYSGKEKSQMAVEFENILNNIASRYGEDITEL